MHTVKQTTYEHKRLRERLMQEWIIKNWQFLLPKAITLIGVVIAALTLVVTYKGYQLKREGSPTPKNNTESITS